MRKHRFYFLEPSKVGSQHITLIEGYLAALASSKAILEKFDLVFCASKATLAALRGSLLSEVECRVVPVMNPEKRRLVLKTIVELFVVLRWLIKLRRGDVLFVSCVLPTTLWLLEFSNLLLRKAGMYVILHGEIEGLFAEEAGGFLRIGYWTVRWMQSRKAGSLISLVVLDDFIRNKLIQEYPNKFSTSNVNVVHLPVLPVFFDAEDTQQRYSICFIGYRTRHKGFEAFLRMASVNPTIDFLAIGGGKVENISDGSVKKIGDKADYLEEISKCSAAVFLYTSGYSCSLSAAALDALSTGVHIIALDRPCFHNLADYFGVNAVTISSSVDEVNTRLANGELESMRQGKELRLEKVISSKYGQNAVRQSFENLVLNVIS